MAEFHGRRCSLAHKTILDELVRRGLLNPADVNSLQRTLADQWRLWRNPPRGADGRPVLVAFPSPFAPHIKVGHANHATDINDDEALRIAQAYRNLGVEAVVFNVPGEGWHADYLDENSLLDVAESLRERGGLLVTLKPGARHDDVRHARKLLLEGGSKLRIPRTAKRHYGRRMVREVKRIQRANDLRADGVIGQATWRRLRIRADRGKR